MVPHRQPRLRRRRALRIRADDLPVSRWRQVRRTGCGWAPHPQSKALAGTLAKIYLGHFAVTDVARHRFRFTAKLARGALGLAGAQPDPFRVWVGNWEIGQIATPEMRPGAENPAWRLQAAGQGYVLSLTARPLDATRLERGAWVESQVGRAGECDLLLLIPRVAVRGTIVRDGQPLQVHGLAWLDREWGSGSLGPQETGWDWFGLQLGDGSCLMFYSLRDRKGTEDPYSAGTWVDPAGHARSLSRGDVRIQVLGVLDRPGRRPLPLAVATGDAGAWPRCHRATGTGGPGARHLAPILGRGGGCVGHTVRHRPITGRGYVELVGYAGTSDRSAGIR